MLAAFQKNWQVYLVEAWALGTFMVSACFFTILLHHPESPVRQAVAPMFFRQGLTGLAMGCTAVALIYSPWGKRSGAHMNPAVTLANWQMERIAATDAAWYVLAQFAGGAAGVFLCKWLAPDLLSHAAVNYAATLPGKAGIAAALAAEFLMSFLLLLAVLMVSNSKHAKWTGFAAGALVMLFITFEAPVSGMSMNPARTVASAFHANAWMGWWLYFAAPVGGMMLAGFAYRRHYRQTHGGNCLSMKCHFSGSKHGCATYEVLGPAELLRQPAFSRMNK